MGDMIPVFTEQAFSAGFDLFEKDLVDLMCDYEIAVEATADKENAAKKTISKMGTKIDRFYVQLRANVIARFNGRRYEANMKKINKAIEKNPDILNTQIEYVDYDALIDKCEKAKKALKNRIEAYTKLCNDNKELLSKKQLTKAEMKKVEQVDKKLRAIAYGEGKWGKGKITKAMVVTAGVTIFIRGTMLYSKYMSITKSIDRDLAARASDAKYLDLFKDRVGISTRTSGYTVSIAEEYSQLLSMEGKLYVNRLSETLKKLMKIISTPGSRTMSSSAVSAISGAKYLESVEDNYLMDIFESMDNMEDPDEHITDDPVDEPVADNNDQEPVEESDDSDDYDPMNGLF